ncbi:hypothetical protein KCU81_g6191, partial [Aureobasidium melanogenum]|uniref:MARVEL domain-containing protein n=1 Tax=Aureobasidium melanogenum (strain CBS 110374) TaxID=1043003 RepID=A0A074VS37_AURM1
MIYPGYRPTARTSEEVQETPKNFQQTVTGLPAWSKAFLITFWVFQILICVVGWGVGALALGTKSLLHDDDDYAYSHGVEIALSVGAGIWIAWASVTFILIVTEIIMFCRSNLKPWFELTSCCIKTTLWLIMFLIASHDVAIDSGNGLALLIVGVFLIFFLIPMIYAGFVLHRHRLAVLTVVESSSV